MLKVVRRQVDKIREINRRYSKPRIEMSPAVRLSLLLLRGYLIFLVALMIFRFVTLVRG
ncbi:MAG: hypothetical protein M0039_03140 [Pseudomonadota bacterium]|nr:hypothetical protein [Pseudomonadota bacterium]